MSIDYYNQNGVEFFNNTVNTDMTSIYEKFLKYVKPHGRILDAGCGSGRDTLYFIRQGFDVISFDASEEMVRLSSQHTGQKTLKMCFEDVDFCEEFDGVWACASLLHVPKDNIIDAIFRLINCLKVDGIFNASFKYGTDEYTKEGRTFNCYNESSLTGLFESFETLKILELWRTSDARPGRENELWINIIAKK